MKNYRYILIVALTALVFSSCEEDLDFFSDDPRDAFIGEWKVKEESTLKTTYYYFVTIEKSESDSTVVYINNFYQSGDDYFAIANVSGSSITIPPQAVSTFNIQGSGSVSFSGNTINCSYTVDFNNGIDEDVATAVFTKEN